VRFGSVEGEGYFRTAALGALDAALPIRSIVLFRNSFLDDPNAARARTL